jgi:hypothetical protein
MMNSSRYNVLLTISLFFIVCSCTKTNNSAIYNAAVTVYVTGDNGTNPVLWKNGAEEILSHSLGFGSLVTVSGNNEYVAGTSDESSSSFLTPAGPAGQYAYWKNDVQYNIGNPGFIEGIVSLTIAGNDLYYSTGYQLWKNGSTIPLQGQGSGHISSIITAGTDVYIAGSDSVGDAVYWKNGVLHVVSLGYYPTYNSGSDPSVFCMFVSGNDIYIGGVSADNRAVYWKNGVAAYMQSSISGSYITNVRSIFVSGNDVYATGNLIVPTNGGSNAPAYWKNGVEIDLPLNGAKYGNTASIFVSGSDVYVAGSTTDGAVYWKNGIESVLSSQGDANYIIVQ